MGVKIVCQNRKAFHDYFIEDTIEAGMVLKGTEVKSLRDGKANLAESYVRIRGGELFICGMHISPYTQADRFTQPDPLRVRKLLVHKSELLRLYGKTREKGFTLIPTKVYFKGGKAKVVVGLAKGKKHFDKRETLKKKAVDRDMKREMKGSR